MAVNLTDQEAQARGERIAESPNLYSGAVSEVEKFATKLQAGSPIPELKGESEAKMRELFEFDKQLEGSYDPLKAKREAMYGGEVVQHPLDVYMPASRAITTGAGGVSDLFSAIGKYQSLEGTALTSALNTIMNFIDMEVKNKQRKEDRAWDIYKFEREMKLKEKEAGGGTATERAESKYIEALRRDVARGVPFYELIPRYKDLLPEFQIREEYNKGPLAAKEGPAKESSGQLAGTVKPTELTAGQKSDIRASLAEDIRGDMERNLDREQSQRENRALYPELDEGEFNNLYNALWPSEEVISGAEKPAVDVWGTIKGLSRKPYEAIYGKPTR